MACNAKDTKNMLFVVKHRNINRRKDEQWVYIKCVEFAPYGRSQLNILATGFF